MIDLYTFTTPNGRKPAIMLEEVGLPYTIKLINIAKGEQHSPEYVAINPNGKIPALVDRETKLTIFESGAILIYLAEKTRQFLPADLEKRFEVIEWLMFQMGGVGPMFGQLLHFRNAASERIDYAIHRYEHETLRLLGVLDAQLVKHEFVAGDYSVADMAIYPWVAVHGSLGISLYGFEHLARWLILMGKRPAVVRGMALKQTLL